MTKQVRTFARRSGVTSWMAVAIALGACSDSGVTGIDEPTASGFTEPISFDELGQSAAASASRIEVELHGPRPPLVARELELEEPTEVTDDETIESRIVAVRPGAGSAVLILEIADLEVEVDGSTRFRDENGTGEMDLTAFLDRVQARIAAGAMPGVEVKRPPPATPQAPEDPTFFATRARLNDESSEPEIEINIDADNLDLSAAAAGRGMLRVLGLEIELDVAGGRTELEREREEARGEVDFEGIVLSADPAAGTVMLAGGLTVHIVDGTEVEQSSGHLRSVEAVASAIAAGSTVEAEGEGVFESAGTLVATEVEFELEDDVQDVPGAWEFEGQVVAVDPATRSFTLAAGTVLTLGDGATFDAEGDLHSLEQMASAVAGTSPVRAEGYAVDPGDGGAWLVLTVKVEVDD